MARRSKKLSLQQEKFCQNFISPGEFYGNGTQAYIDAFDIDVSKRGMYDCAKSGACRLLTYDYINTRINSLLDKAGFNAEHADKRLLHWMNQNQDGNVSVRAIQEFNKLKQRITEKIEHSIVPVTGIDIVHISNVKTTTTKKQTS